MTTKNINAAEAEVMTLTDFLLNNPVAEVIELCVISKRLANYPFKIKAMTGPEFNQYQKLCTAIRKGKKVEFNNRQFNELVILNHCLEPNFRSEDFIKKAECRTPEDCLYKTLLAGEIVELSQQISSLSGFDTDLDDLVEEAKN